MGRLTTEKEEQDLRTFLQDVADERIKVEVFPVYADVVKQNCGKGLYKMVLKVLSQFPEARFRLVFKEKEPACWLSRSDAGIVVVNLARLSGLRESLPGIVKQSFLEEALVK